MGRSKNNYEISPKKTKTVKSSKAGTAPSKHVSSKKKQVPASTGKKNIKKDKIESVPELINNENLGHIIDDTVKFSVSLGFKSTDEMFTSGVFSVMSGIAIGFTVNGALTASAAATAAALTAAAVANLGFFAKIGVTLGIISAPVVAPVAVPIAIPIAAGVGGGVVFGSLYYFIKTKGKKFATYGGYKSFNTPIDRLGQSISGKIFIPILGLIKASNRSNYDFLRKKMIKYGYSKWYTEAFIKYFSEMDISKIKKAIINCNNWLEKLTRKVENKLSKKDIDYKSLYLIIKEMAYDCGGSAEFINFIKEKCK